MRHRLFHAIVIAGASMACGGGEESSSSVDAGAAPVDSNVADSSVADSSVVDSSAPETITTLDATPDACDGGCGSSCFPCIK